MSTRALSRSSNVLSYMSLKNCSHNTQIIGMWPCSPHTRHVRHLGAILCSVMQCHEMVACYSYSHTNMHIQCHGCSHTNIHMATRMATRTQTCTCASVKFCMSVSENFRMSAKVTECARAARRRGRREGTRRRPACLGGSFAARDSRHI